jgi:hypothetical protein
LYGYDVLQSGAGDRGTTINDRYFFHDCQRLHIADDHDCRFRTRRRVAVTVGEHVCDFVTVDNDSL